jgi:hypothetical protein
MSGMAQSMLLVVICVLEIGRGIVSLLEDEVEDFDPHVDFESLVELVSVEQSTKLHRSLQLGKHISVQFVVPPGQPQVHRSTFEL